MPKIQVPINTTPRQIEFDESVKRSVPGALYFTPGSVKIVTKEEMESMRKQHPKYAQTIIILSDEEPKTTQNASPAKGSDAEKPIGPKYKQSQSKARAATRLAGAHRGKTGGTNSPRAKNDDGANKTPPNNAPNDAQNVEPPSGEHAKKDGAPTKGAK